jgi:hypothetical protein
MIQAAIENKYRFNMQVSVAAMAGLEATSAIGVTYTRILNRYLFCGLPSPSEAPRSATWFA